MELSLPGTKVLESESSCYPSEWASISNSPIVRSRYGDHSLLLCWRLLTGNDVTNPRDDVTSVSWPTSRSALLPVCCITWPETESIHGDQTPRDDVISPEAEALIGVEVAGSRWRFLTMNVLGMAIGGRYLGNDTVASTRSAPQDLPQFITAY